MAEAFAVFYTGATRFITPYEPEYLDELKRVVPYFARQYHRESRTWTVAYPYDAAALDLASNYWTVERLYPTPPAAPQATSCNPSQCLERLSTRYPHHAALRLWPEAPQTVIQAAYRALALTHHPDRVGADGHTQMVAINRAYEALREAR